MTDLIAKITKQILSDNDISRQNVEKLISNMLSTNLDQAEIFFQNIYSESWLLEDGEVKDGSFSIDKGVGVRAVVEDKTGFAFSDDIALPSLQEATSTANSIAKFNQNNQIKIPWHTNSNSNLIYQPANPISTSDRTIKIDILKKVDKLAKSDPRVERVEASLTGTYEVVLIANNDGEWIGDIRPLIRINISIVAKQNGRTEKGYAGYGGRFSYDQLIQDNIVEKIVSEALKQAFNNLESIPAPAGMMTVVLGPGWPGVLLHEAVGHGLEGDFIRKKVSTFTNMLGQRVASPGVTVIDNGTLLERRGSLNVDDEGTVSQENVLIEDGILKGFMFDKLNARLMNTKPTGNGRRENYAYLPMPRMTNTYMAPGKYDPNEIIQSVSKGIYATNFGGGQVDITSGKFVFNLNEAFLIEDGKLTQPIKGATLTGNGPEALKHISMIGNNLELDNGVGICGKDGQSVPVGVGQPTVKLDNMIVGGTG